MNPINITPYTAHLSFYIRIHSLRCSLPVPEMRCRLKRHDLRAVSEHRNYVYITRAIMVFAKAFQQPRYSLPRSILSSSLLSIMQYLSLNLLYTAATPFPDLPYVLLSALGSLLSLWPPGPGCKDRG